MLAKGFGWADLAKRTPVIADRTLFDVQSVSKLFTITAVMQATERGFVNFDEDVNRYLKTFQVEPTFSQPVRLFDLMTHTSGLEDQGVGITARRESDWLPLGNTWPGRCRATSGLRAAQCCTPIAEFAWRATLSNRPPACRSPSS